ncbi:hypothetical protein KSP40_PGU022033 [Platanthera guangdongensis]|uniref:Uncharacterized protein n=1 Tax=Platanthera guangdongensis TaxID=2320717 RepID=A0ABR2M0L6_9ASPA
MIHDNLSDRMAFVPAMHHSNICPINFRWTPPAPCEKSKFLGSVKIAIALNRKRDTTGRGT